MPRPYKPRQGRKLRGSDAQIQVLFLVGNIVRHGMKTTIDAAGRLVIPRAIRQQAGVQGGTLLEVSWRDGRIEIEPAEMPVRLVQEGRLLVAVAAADVAPLTISEVNATLEEMRRERGGSA
jgi:AbrB family looped-hinge helix DNA binding protein